MARILGTRFHKHMDGKHPNSAVTEHTANTGHTYTLDDVKDLVKEERNFDRKVLKALTIHKHEPELNRD